MEASRPSPQSSREQITLPTIEGFEDSSGRVCLSRATTSTFAIDYRRPTESPSSAFGRTASPVACASCASTAIVGGNNPLPLVSTVPVRHIEAMGSDARQVTEYRRDHASECCGNGYRTVTPIHRHSLRPLEKLRDRASSIDAGNSPDPPLPSHYDAVIFHDVRDWQQAELFRMRLLDMLKPIGEGPFVSLFGYDADLGRSYYEHLEDTVRRSTYLMLFVTRNLCEDRVIGALLRDQLLSEMLANPEKRWCLVPIWTEPVEKYTKPMALCTLMGIAEKSVSDKFRCGSVVRLFTDKRSSRLAREQAEREHQAKEAEQKLQKLKDDEAERQHKERLQQLNDDHQRELRNAQRDVELTSLLKKNELALLEEDNSALVGNQLMQMQFIQQNARHLRDQHVLEEWQRDAQGQAQMMAGSQMPGRAPSVLRPGGGNGPLSSNGNLWASTIGPDGQAYVAVAADSGSPMYLDPVSQLPDNSGSPASCLPQTVTAGRAAPDTRSWASKTPPLLPVGSCTPEETLRQAHDLLQRLNLKSPQTPPSVDPQPPPYSELFGSPADVLPSRIFAGAPPSGKDATPATGTSVIRSQGRATSHRDAASPRASDQAYSGRQSNLSMPVSVPFAYTGSRHRESSSSQPSSWANTGRDFSSFGSGHYPSALGYDDAPLGTGSSSASEGAGSFSSGPLSVGSLGSRGGSSSSVDSGHGHSSGWQAYSRAIQPRDTSLSFVASDPYTSSAQQHLPALQLHGAAAAAYVSIDPQRQLQLPPGFVACHVEELAALRAMLHQFQSPPRNVYWPSTGGPLQQQAPSQQLNEVDKKFAEPVPASFDNEVREVSSVPKFSISKLVPVLTKEMDRYIHRFPTFSYQFGWKGELTAYVSDLSNDAIDDLKKELEKQLCQHIPEEHVKVTVVSRLPTMMLCCGGIGTTLNIGEDSQLIGLYLQYDGDGTIFWVSSAHGLLRASDREHLRGAPSAVPPPQVEIIRRIRSRFSACLDLRAVELLAPYIVFQYNGVVLSHNQDILHRIYDDHVRNCAVQKPTLCHSVDIMIGPTPLTNWHLKGSLATYARLLTSAIDGCGQPPLCTIACHASTTQFYRITGIRQFDVVSFDNIASFDMEDLNNIQLLSYLGREDRLAKGTVCNIPCNRYRTIVAGHEYVLQNVIVIQPTEGSCRPRQGQSGSVWVQQRGDKSEAVAITCAVIQCPENPTVEMWLAAPLCACLLALSEEYPHVFEDYSKFTVLI